MIIGTVNGKNVRYSELNKMVRVAYTDIVISGVNSLQDAIKICQRNFKGYEGSINVKV